eukprot:7900591-Alexandrium_andersonii.AAC.1
MTRAHMRSPACRSSRSSLGRGGSSKSIPSLDVTKDSPDLSLQLLVTGKAGPVGRTRAGSDDATQTGPRAGKGL